MSASDSYVRNLYADALTVPAAGHRIISRELFRSLTVISEASVDFVITTACTFVAFILQLHFSHQSVYPVHKLVIAAAILGLFAALSLQRVRQNSALGTLVTLRETEQIIRTTIYCQLLLLLVALLLDIGSSFSASLFVFIVIPVSLMTERRLFTLILRALHAKGYGAQRVVVYAAEETGSEITSALTHSPQRGLYPVALICNDAIPAANFLFRLGDQHRSTIPVNRSPLTTAVLKSLDCNLLIVAAPDLSPAELATITQAAEHAQSSVAVLHDLTTRSKHSAEWIEIDGMAALSNLQPVTTMHFMLFKRIADILISSMLLVLLAPLLLVIVALIRIDSPGPAFFIQKRVGRQGELFHIFKFRSMHATAPRYALSPQASSDPRITRVGRILRRTSLDELPQLINVLLGNMSLVGPRPEMPFLVERYSAEHRPRLQVHPGITGLWQLSADRPFPLHENIHYDLYYIRNRSFCLDLAILLHTLLFAMRGGV